MDLTGDVGNGTHFEKITVQFGLFNGVTTIVTGSVNLNYFLNGKSKK